MSKSEEVIGGFRELVNKLEWLNKQKMEALLGEYKSSEVHFIESIGRNEDANVTKLAESFYMTRGAISKIAKKLLAKGVIESYQKPDNKKELYFRLTEHGIEVYNIHDALHREFQKRDSAVFESVTEEQFDDMLNLLKRYREHLAVEIKKQGLSIKPE